MCSAARLFAACRTAATQSERWWGLPQTHEHDLASVRAHLGEPAVAEAWAEGQSMTLEQAITAVLQDPAALS
jgi:hypothetical protein